MVLRSVLVCPYDGHLSIKPWAKQSRPAEWEFAPGIHLPFSLEQYPMIHLQRKHLAFSHTFLSFSETCLVSRTFSVITLPAFQLIQNDPNIQKIGVSEVSEMFFFKRLHLIKNIAKTVFYYYNGKHELTWFSVTWSYRNHLLICLDDQKYFYAENI